MNKLTNIFMFAGGAIIGSVVTWALVKTKYEQLAQEEIDSVKETFSSKKEEPTIIEEEPESEEVGNTMDRYETILSNSGYTEEVEDVNGPYVISPEEFDEDNDYETQSLTYYKDKVLADDWGRVIDTEDIEEMVGLDSLTHFGEYEDDSVFVKNDRLKTYFEILLDERSYRDVYVVEE